VRIVGLKIYKDSNNIEKGKGRMESKYFPQLAFRYRQREQ
jgi:hypothetical protein